MSQKRNKYQRYYSIWIFVVSLDISLIWECKCTAPAEVDKHLQMGMQLMAQGKMSDALSHLHAAIDGDPNNYMSYYRRATVYLALGRARLALLDLEKTLKLKPDFTAANVRKCSILIKVGRIDEAYMELEKILQKNNKNQDANELMNKCNILRKLILQARDAFESRHYDQAIDLLKEIIEETPWDASAREMRSEAYMGLGETSDAIADLRAVSKLTQDNTENYLKLSKLYYTIGDIDLSLNELRECLKLDPEHSSCFPFYKKVKKISKFASKAKEYSDAKQFEECVTSSNGILKEEKSEPQILFLGYEKLCTCEAGSGSAAEAVAWCTKALKINEEPRLYCDRADAHIINGDYDDAISDFKKASEINEDFRRAHEGLKKANKLKKQASKRDYYKILGVKRNANKKTILKAYRKLAADHHPDKFTGDEKEKEKAQKQFIDIAAAKEVLTDPEKRQKFDQGEDPLDPEAQQGGFPHGFNPFEHAFRQQGGFGGGGFEFKFGF